MNERIQIGDFSEMTGVSKRMIRHFDKIDLLKPTYIDEYNGYRFYSEKQVSEVQKIRFLQDFGFTLKTISEILSRPLSAEEFLEKLKDQEVTLRNDSDELIHQLLKLKKLISYMEQYPNHLNNVDLNEFEIERSMPMNDYEVLKEAMKKLPNNEVFFEKMEETFNKVSGEKLYFVTFDIDEFIQVNEDYGYDVGDKVIYRFYQIISRKFADVLAQNANNMIARLGGDEFVIFSVNTTNEAIISATQNVIKEFGECDFKQDGCKKRMTCSSGISVKRHIDHPGELRHFSTKALLEAKKAGRNQYKMIEKL